VKPSRVAAIVATLGICLASVPPTIAASAPGSLDASFSGNGIASLDLDHRAFDTFKGIDVRGSTVFATGSANGRLTLAKFLPSGRLDRSFGGGDGIVRTDFGRRTYGQGIAFLPHRRIVIVGGAVDARGHTRLAVFVFRGDGRLDRRFSGDGKLALRPPDGLRDWFGFDALVQRDGKILAIGETYSSTLRKPGNFAVARIKPSGTRDKTFSGKGTVSVSFARGDDGAWEGRLMGDGRLVLAGWVWERRTGTWDTGLARLTRSGKLDTTFSHDGKLVLDLYDDRNDLGYGLALRRTGAIVVGSRAYGIGGGGITQPVVAQVTRRGRLDTGFGGGDGKAVGFARGSYFYDLAIDDAHRIVGVAGHVRTGNMLSFRLKRRGRPDGRYGRNGVKSTGVNGNLFEMRLDSKDRPVSVGSYGQNSAAFRLVA
jgi:uncharacterized delta-60 repeat protein